MDLIQIINDRARNNKVKIGMGVGEGKWNREVIENSIAKAKRMGISNILEFNNPEELVSALKSSKINGAVRGTLPAKETMSQLKIIFKEGSIYRAVLINIEDKYTFFLAPVGIDEGIFIDERFQLVKMIDSLLKPLDIKSKVAIISGGRLGEDVGRSGVVEESLKAGEKLFHLVKEAGLDVKHHGILIEEAYKDANIIIAPNGIVGNLLFRTLHFLGKCKSYGAPVLNLDKTFIDTSRSKIDYSDSLLLACALSR
jgi:putative methanogen marker protein 4